MPIPSAQFTSVYGQPDVTSEHTPFDEHINAVCVDAFPALDVNVDGDKLDVIRAFMDNNNIHLGDKKSITKEAYTQLFSDIQTEMGAKEPQLSAGGTGANFAAGLKALLQGHATVGFMGIVSDDQSTDDATRKSQSMLNSFKKAGVDLCLPVEKNWPVIESIVAWGTNANGRKDRAIIKQTSQQKPSEYLTESNLITLGADKALQQSNLIFMVGNMIGRAHEMHDLVLRHYMSGGKVLAFSGPTDYKMAMDNQHEIEHILRYSDIAMFNAEEAMAAFGTDPDKLPTLPGSSKVDPAQRQVILQDTLKKMVNVFHSTPPRSWQRYRKGQVGIVTDGGKGIYIVTGQGYAQYDAVPVSQIKNTLGAGDICFSSFVAAYMRGCSHEMSALIAQTAAAEKLKINAARHPNVLKCLPPELKAPFMNGAVRQGGLTLPRGAASAPHVA